MNVPIPSAQVFTNLQLLVPLNKKFLISLCNGKIMLKIITFGSQSISFCPVLCLLPKNNLFLFFYLASVSVELCLLGHPPSLPFLDKLLVFPEKIDEYHK
jgi:hypothetical protein